MSQRLLLLNTDFQRGGTPTVVRELATRLRQRGHDVEAACLSPQGPLGEEMVAAGVPVTALGARGITDIAVLGRLAGFLRQRRFDVVLSFLMHANVAAAYAASGVEGVRWLQSVQTTQVRPRWHWLAQRWAARRAQRIIVPSPSVAECAAARAGIGRDKISIIPNGIEASRFAGLAPRQPSQPASVGFIGRLDPVKRLPDLLAATASLGAEVQLHIFGEGPERKRLETTVAQRAMQSRVTLHGLVPSSQEALGRIDVLVLCSEAEGMPMVLLEAMAAGVPIVATDAPGIRDTVRHESTALLSPVGDSPALASNISRVLRDATLRERLVGRAGEEVRARYSWEQIIPQYESILFGE